MPTMASARPAGQGRLARLRANLQTKAAELRADDDAAFEMTRPIAIAFTIIGGIVLVIVVAGLVPSFSSAVGNASTSVTTADWGNDTVNTIASPFGMLMALAGLFSIVGIVIGAVALNKGK